jgi:hypothetical protein
MNALFAHGLTNLAGAVTPAIGGGAENADFPRANLGDLNPANPFKFAGNTGRLVWDFGSAQPVQLVALIHHNLSAGLNVRWQGNATDSWGAPSLDQAFTIGAASIDNYRPNAWLDLSGLSHSFRFWSLVIVDANAAPIVLGDLWFNAVKRTFVHNYAWPYGDGEQRPARRELVTRGGVRFTYPGVGRQRLLSSAVQTSVAGLEALRDWHRSTNGGDRPSLFIPDPAASIRDAWLGYWGTPQWEPSRQFLDDGAVPFSFLECAYGGSW